MLPRFVVFLQISLRWHSASASPYSPTVIQATGLSHSQACLPSADLVSRELYYLTKPCGTNHLGYLKRGGGGHSTAVSGNSQKGLNKNQNFLKRQDWTCCFCFSVCCAGCSAAGRSPPDGCADGCCYIWNISRGAVAEYCHGTCQVCHGPMLLQPKLRGILIQGRGGWSSYYRASIPYTEAEPSRALLSTEESML